jgi:hypothetical protein
MGSAALKRQVRESERRVDPDRPNAEANPYVLGVTVRAEVQARMALGQFDDAQQSGEGALAWLGDRVPQIRSLILSTLATELRAAPLTLAVLDLDRPVCASPRASASPPPTLRATSSRSSPVADQRLYDAKRAGRNCVFSTIAP